MSFPAEAKVAARLGSGVVSAHRLPAPAGASVRWLWGLPILEPLLICFLSLHGFLLLRRFHSPKVRNKKFPFRTWKETLHAWFVMTCLQGRQCASAQGYGGPLT